MNYRSKSNYQLQEQVMDIKGKIRIFCYIRPVVRDAQQGEIFAEVVHRVESALEGDRVCIFSYGKNGSGKTHTIIGGEKQDARIIPRAIEHAFHFTAS